MSNGQVSGAGDGPPSLIDMNRNTDWTHLPSTLCHAIGHKLDNKGLRAMRLVCKKWRENVEQRVGLKIKVDDSIEGNLEIAKKVKVRSSRVINWTVDLAAEPASFLFQYPDWLKKLKLCGKMPAQWKIHDLRQFPNLAHLVLRDKDLHSNNLSGHQYPIINFDLTKELSVENTMIQAFQTQDPPSEAQPIELKSLQTLEIVRHEYHTKVITTELELNSYLLMMANMCFILSHLKSPVLSVVHLTMSIPWKLDTDLRGNRGPFTKLNWKLVPLHKFLYVHRTSLRQLYLPRLNACSNVLREHEYFPNSFPDNLKKLMLHLYGEDRDPYFRHELSQPTFTYLQRCLAAQTQLEEVHFDFSGFPVKWASDACTALANSCGRTLRYLELHCYPDEYTGTIDLQVFSVCHSLEVLDLPSWGRCSMNFKNIEKLPTSLKRLVICEGEGGQLDIVDPNVFKRLVNLEWLYLELIHLVPATDTDNGNEQQQRELCRAMIKGLLGLRQLQGVYLTFRGFELQTDRNIVAMLNLLGENIDPTSRYPHLYFSFNFSYSRDDGRPIPPWSDKPFDNDSWDIERYHDEVQEPPTELARTLQDMGRDEADENANDMNDGDVKDKVDDDMDVNTDEEDLSSDEDDF